MTVVQNKTTLDGLNFAGSIPAEGTMNTKRNTQKEIVPKPNKTRCKELDYIGFCIEYPASVDEKVMTMTCKFCGESRTEEFRSTYTLQKSDLVAARGNVYQLFGEGK